MRLHVKNLFYLTKINFYCVKAINVCRSDLESSEIKVITVFVLEAALSSCFGKNGVLKQRCN